MGVWNAWHSWLEMVVIYKFVSHHRDRLLQGIPIVIETRQGTNVDQEILAVVIAQRTYYTA